MDIAKHKQFLLSEIKVINPHFSQKLIMDLVDIMTDEGKPRHNKHYSELLDYYFPFSYTDPNINNLRDILNTKPIATQMEFYEKLKEYMKKIKLI